MNEMDQFWQGEPILDDRVHEIPESVQHQVYAIAHAIAAKGFRATPERVAATMRRINLAPLEPELLLGLLMRNWWMIAEEIEPEDTGALQAHLDQAPVQNHPSCVYMRGMIAGFSAGRWHGHIESFKETKRGCSVTPPIEEGIA